MVVFIINLFIFGWCQMSDEIKLSCILFTLIVFVFETNAVEMIDSLKAFCPRDITELEIGYLKMKTKQECMRSW
jgi:hypothetical protein